VTSFFKKNIGSGYQFEGKENLKKKYQHITTDQMPFIPLS
jgi:hypothetical protein